MIVNASSSVISLAKHPLIAITCPPPLEHIHNQNVWTFFVLSVTTSFRFRQCCALQTDFGLDLTNLSTRGRPGNWRWPARQRLERSSDDFQQIRQTQAWILEDPRRVWDHMAWPPATDNNCKSPSWTNFEWCSDYVQCSLSSFTNHQTIFCKPNRQVKRNIIEPATIEWVSPMIIAPKRTVRSNCVSTIESCTL